MGASFVTQQIDYIESEVYKRIKPLGFRKHGRTLHRFVSGDISQVISFQCGQAYLDATHLMWVNIGIRIPECTERRFDAVNSRIFSVELCYGNRASMTGKDCFRGKRICKRRVIYALSDFLIMILSWLVKQSLRAFLFQEVQP